MTRSSLLLAVAATVAGCNAIVGVEPLTLDDAGSPDTSPTLDAAVDATQPASDARGRDAPETNADAADATLEPDEGPADVSTEDAIGDATFGEAAPDAGGMDGEAGGGSDGEASAPDGGTDGGAAPDADAGPRPDNGDASLSDDGGDTDAGAAEDAAD